MKCYSCNIELRDNNLSEEHIFPNTIGGKIISKFLLCSSCNTKFGIYDKEIDRLFGAFTIQYGIKRDRDGYHPPIFGLDGSTNKSVMLHSNGRTSFTDPITEFTDNAISVNAYNLKRAKQELEKVKLEMEKKGFLVDTSELKITKEVTENNNVTYIDLMPNYYLLIKGILRIFLNSYIHKNGQASLFYKAVEFVKDTRCIIDNRYCTYYYADLKNKIHNGKVVHSIVFKNENNFIKGYIELFGAIGFVALLSHQYKGKDFNVGYAYTIDTFEESELLYGFNERVDQIIDEIRKNEQADTYGLMKTIII